MDPESALELKQRKERVAAALGRLSRSHNAAAQIAHAQSFSQAPLSGVDLVNALYDCDVKVFTDVGGEAWFTWDYMPGYIRESGQDATPQHCRFQCLLPVPSRKLRSFLNAWIYVEEVGQLKPGAMNEALSILEGLAFMNRQPCDLETAVDINPLLETLLALLEEEPDWEGTASDLFVALGRISREREWHFKSQPHWPKNASQLSRELGSLDDLLKDAGIAHEYHRRGNRRRHCFGLLAIPMNLEGTPEQGGEGVAVIECAQSISAALEGSGGSATEESPLQVVSRPVAPPPVTSPQGVTSDTSDGVLTPNPSPSPILSVAKFIANERCARSDGSDGDFPVSPLEVASPALPNGWQRAVKKKKARKGTRSGGLQAAAPS